MILETGRLAIQAIFRNALRSSLTVLGVVIGVAAVIAMVTLGQGTTARVATEVAQLGSNLLMVMPGQEAGGPASGGGSAASFTIRDVDAVADQIPGALTAAPFASRTMTLVFGAQNHSSAVTGTDNRYFIARDWPIEYGRDFYESELRAGSAACVIGDTTRSLFFGTGDPIGETIRVGQISCRIIGVLVSRGSSSFGSDQDDIVIMPLRTFQRRIAGNADVNMIYVAVREGFSTAKVIRDIELLMHERRQIATGEEDDFNVFDMEQVASMLSTVTGILTGLLAAVAGVSLLVGGIGIMNIMLVSVTERTKEIGIRLAIGASERQILMQFLVEAIVLSLFGGIIGIGLGLALAAIAGSFLDVPFIIDPLVVFGAFAFSAAIGVIFGYFPARQAARLNPIEALRRE
ncbi:ABC transporter permease [Devosia neptuniae]|mgnify:CR=1 FL=1|jgi:putative ABC transport system permease protein|uniref:ABC transporter permease n=1 Tax=Devosia TaxID=46913 RepID=UPI0022AE58B9|nr:ABC transporter permease [Devosia neptuniae]MCZ4345196.1 ABC transporter permease [Devosia neptuniae]|tara:strand:- start:5588 stop:6799 length:1212 start_codon:yes stop_codon:yes gene_type:complete